MAESLKSRLQNGELCRGTFLLFTGGIDFPLFLKGLGFDFFIFDLEHSTFGLEKTRETILSARSCGISCIVRIPELQYHFVSRILDAGADGIILPRMESREEAEKLVEYGRYRPEGRRGISTFSGHNDFKRPADVPSFLAERNRDILLVAQVETVKGVEKREEILSVPGIDVCFIGPGDLAMGMGLAGQPGHPEVVANAKKVIETAKKYGLATSLPILNPESIEFWVRSGITMLTLGTDSILFSSGAGLFFKEVSRVTGK